MFATLTFTAARRRSLAARRGPWLVLLCHGLSQATALNANITDQTGRPLADAVVMLEPTTSAAAVKAMADVEIAQRNRQFVPQVTLITTGTRVTFPNFDTVRHHVYSFSPVKQFELKLYAAVPSAPVLFDKPGIAVLGCNIHDTMVAWVVVADTPWAARSLANGQAQISGVPAGTYRLRLWHAGMRSGNEPVTLPLTLGVADLTETFQLVVSAEP